MSAPDPTRSTSSMPALARIAARLRADGFAFEGAAAMRAALAPFGGVADFDAFAATWDDLGVDTYMADGGRYRKRRHAVFAAAPGQPLRRKPHQPHYQSRDYNPLNGGIARWFEPMLPACADTTAFRAILDAHRALCDALSPEVAASGEAWHIECHQFRIEARAGTEGRPTPEGAHRDGVDHVLVLLVARHNVTSGETTVALAEGGAPLGAFTLTAPLDAALVDDARVMHGVTPIVPLDPGRPGHRDVLVVTARR